MSRRVDEKATLQLRKSLLEHAGELHDKAVFRSAISSGTKVYEKIDYEGEKYDREKSARLKSYLELQRKKRAERDK